MIRRGQQAWYGQGHLVVAQLAVQPALHGTDLLCVDTSQTHSRLARRRTDRWAGATREPGRRDADASRCSGRQAGARSVRSAHVR